MNISNVFKGNVVVVGVGNILRGDDAFGVRLVENIRDNVKALCIDAGTSPENYIGKIAKENPDTVIIVDAAHLGKKAGGYELLEKEEILASGFTTHDLSPRIFLEELQRRTSARIYMLAVQPERIAFGEEMSANVKKTLEKLTRELLCMKHI